MQKNNNLFFEQIEPPKGLFGVVLNKINEEKARVAKRNAIFSGIASFLSVIAMIGTGQYLTAELSRTGFYSYTSLFVSDWASITYFWKEILASIAESLPIFGVVALLASFTVLLGSAKTLIKNIAGVKFLKINLF